MHTLDRALYLNADKTKIVEEGDPAMRFVLGVAGSVISDEDAKKYGLEEFLAATSKVTKQLEPVETETETEPDEEKAVKPAQNKARQLGVNKGS